MCFSWPVSKHIYIVALIVTMFVALHYFIYTIFCLRKLWFWFKQNFLQFMYWRTVFSKVIVFQMWRSHNFLEHYNVSQISDMNHNVAILHYCLCCTGICFCSVCDEHFVFHSLIFNVQPIAFHNSIIMSVCKGRNYIWKNNDKKHCYNICSISLY
jgi:hypothetical protein